MLSLSSRHHDKTGFYEEVHRCAEENFHEPGEFQLFRKRSSCLNNKAWSSKESLSLLTVCSLSLGLYSSGHLNGLPGGSDGSESAFYVGEPGLNAGLGRSLEKKLAAHSRFLAWGIPWMEEPGGPLCGKELDVTG